MTEANTNGWSDEREYENEWAWKVAVRLLKGITLGTIAGLSTFVYMKSELMTVTVNPLIMLGITALSGMFSHLYADGLRDSIRLSLVSYVIGWVVYFSAWLAPLWLLSYTPGARDLLLPGMMGDAVSGVILVYSMVYNTGYFSAITVDAYR